jgi:hypothetical protein
METDRSFLHITLQNFNCRVQSRETLTRWFRCFMKFAPIARGLVIDCSFKARDFLVVLSFTKKIEKLEIRNGISRESSNCQFLLSLNRHIIDRLTIRTLKVNKCDEIVAEILLMLRPNTIVDLDLEEFPITQLPQFIAAQNAISSLRVIYSKIEKNSTNFLDKIAGNLRLSSLQLRLNFVKRDDPKIDSIIAEIISSQPNLTHLDLRVGNAGEKIFAAIMKLQLKTLVMEVPGKVLGEVRMLFKSMELESLTLYGPRRSCVNYFKIKDECAKPTLKKFEYKFVD